MLVHVFEAHLERLPHAHVLDRTADDIGRHARALLELDDRDRVRTEGATLQGIHTPGHAPDHLCFLLEEEGALFSGDNVLGVGTTVIPAQSGDLAQYMSSLDRLLAEKPKRIYPAHGPFIEDGPGKIQEYIDHRLEREDQILAAMDATIDTVPAIVEIVYAAYPKALHAAAGQSVTSHLVKLEREARVARAGETENATADRWTRARPTGSRKASSTRPASAPRQIDAGGEG